MSSGGHTATPVNGSVPARGWRPAVDATLFVGGGWFCGHSGENRQDE